MDKSKSAPTGHKFILPKLIATPKAEPGNARPPHFLLQKKPVLIRLEKGGKVIEPSTANPVSKRENLDDGEGNVKRVKLDGRVFFQAQDKNRNVGKSASSAQQSTSAALPGSQYARMAGNPVQTFAAPMPMARVSALQSHAQPRMPQPQVYYPQPQMPQVAMQQPLVAMQQPQVAMQQPQVAMQQPRVAMQQPRVAMQQPQHEFRHQAVGSTPSERRQRLLRVQFYHRHLVHLLRHEQQQHSHLVNSIQSECATVPTPEEKGAVVRKYSHWQQLNEARLAKVRGQLAKLQEFWNKRTAMLMQQNELAAHSMQLYNTAQYPAAGYGEQYQQYQPAQPVQQYQPALPVQQSQPAYYLQVLGEVKTENTETPSTYQDPGQHYAVQPGPSQPQGHCGPSQASCDPGFILPDQMTPPPSDCSPMQSESHSPAEPGHEHAVKTEIPTPERLPPAQDASPGFSKSLLDSDLLTLSQDQLLDMLLNDNTSPAAAPVAGLSMPDLGDEQLHPEPVGNSAGADDSAAGPSSTSHLWDELLSIING